MGFLSASGCATWDCGRHAIGFSTHEQSPCDPRRFVSLCHRDEPCGPAFEQAFEPAGLGCGFASRIPDHRGCTQHEQPAQVAPTRPYGHEGRSPASSSAVPTSRAFGATSIRLLFSGLDRHKAHRRSGHGLADRRGVGRVGFAAFDIRRHDEGGINRTSCPSSLISRPQ